MTRFVVFVFCIQFFAGIASAQFVTSGSGTGQRGGDQGLTSPTSLAQSLGYDSDEDFEDAQEQGYGDNEIDAEAWGLASGGNYDVDCLERFRKKCDDVDAEDFKPLVPEIQISIGMGFDSLSEMDDFVDGIEDFGGDTNDASNCKKQGYASTASDLQLCMVATNDEENEDACRNKLGLSDGEAGDCSDMDRDDYEDVANNLPPKIIYPEDWLPGLTYRDVNDNSSLISVLNAVDPDGDKLTWSLQSVSKDIFKIDVNSGVVTLNADGEANIPDSATITVEVSDGLLSDTLAIPMSFEVTGVDDEIDIEAAKNNPPKIITPDNFKPADIGDGVNGGEVVISGLIGEDPDGDKLTWSIDETSSKDTFKIDPETGQVSLKCATGPIRENPTCFWMENKSPYCWVPAEQGFYRGGGKSQCFNLDSCDGGQGASNGGCYKWAYSESSRRIDWANGENAQQVKPASQHSIKIKLSDGSLYDTKDVSVSISGVPEVVEKNGPPKIILPADWMPSAIPSDASEGTTLVNVLKAIDPDGDELTWSIKDITYRKAPGLPPLVVSSDIMSIDVSSAQITLSQKGEEFFEVGERPVSIKVRVQVSDGELTDEEELSIQVELKKVNNPPEIIVPNGFADKEFPPYPANTLALGSLIGQDQDGDRLTWSILEGDPSIFSINADTGAVSFDALGSDDQLACTSPSTAAAGSQTAATRVASSSNKGIVSVSSSVFQDHDGSDFRTARKGGGGSFTTTRKYHVVLERENHRGGSFTTEARNASSYKVGSGSSSIPIPALASASINSNVTPINSYLVFQNNGSIDLSNTNGQVTFQNPIIGIYYTDAGFDKTITRLGKPGALYTRMSQRDKLGLENGKDIAWIDQLDRRKLNIRSRTNKIGDFIRVITAATDTEEVDEDDTTREPDTCTAQFRVELSDGQATDEETIKVSFLDPNRKPDVFGPMDWMPSTVANSKKAGDQIINALAARDPDGDQLIWSLEGANSNLFSIGKFDGKISLSQAYEDAEALPTEANVIVKVSDGKLTDNLALNIPMEKKPEIGSMASNIGTNGSFQFVSGDVRNIFNQDYTIMARFFHGSGGYSDPYFDYNKRKWLKRDAKETIFFWGGNVKQPPVKFLSGISLHVVGDTIRLQLGSDGSYLETRASIQRNHWHTVMFVVDAEQRRKTKKHNWPVKMYLNGQRVGLNEFKTTSKNKGYKPIGTPEGYWPKQIGSHGNREADVENDNTPVAAIGVAGTVKPAGQNGMHWSIIQRRHLPLRSSSFIHEVSIWQGDKSSVASGIYNNNRDVADYASTSVGKPRYSWKPGLLGQSKTEVHCGNIGAYVNYMRGRYFCRGTPAGDDVLEKHKDWTPSFFNNSNPKAFVIDHWKGTVTLANLANGTNPENGKSDYVGPTAGNGIYRLDGDMHLYSGGFTFETEVYNRQFRKRFTGFVRAVPSNAAIDACDTSRTVQVSNLPIKAWHQGSTYNRLYFSGLKRWHGWSAHCLTYNDDDIKAFATRAMSGKTKPLN